MDATTCKELGNEAMSAGDYVDALKYYSQAIALNPRDAALHSNRSFCFLRLGLNARAIVDADDAIRLKPSWPKGHFRRAAALSQAGLHERALESYSSGAALDPSDEHLRSQCVEANRCVAAAKWTEKLTVIGAAAAVAVVLALVALDGTVGAGYLMIALFCGATIGSASGATFVLFRRQQRESSVLAPLQSNHDFAAMQMMGDTRGAGELRAAPSAPQLSGADGTDAPMGAAGTAAGAAGAAGAPASAAKSNAARRSTQNGRAAALRAKKEGRI